MGLGSACAIGQCGIFSAKAFSAGKERGPQRGSVRAFMSLRAAVRGDAR